ncbi:MAG TPA: MBL fold metallo-hydrolase [Pyrinomonadaceae bacterium]|nr:MBL fold metallo-hydrolase [Pyrinomonadaceae bacterium]
MRNFYGKTLVLFTFTIIFCVQFPAQTKQTENSEVQKVAEGVYTLIRKEPPSLWFDPNVTFIINEADVIVVDANITSKSSKEVIAALKKLTDKPVKYVINTHWHEDHIIGNKAYREAFPNVEFIGHISTLKDLPTVGASNRKQTLENGGGFVKYLKEIIGKNQNLEGKPITEEERLGYSSDIKIIEQYLAESKDFQIILPTIAVEDSLTIHRGSRTIEILHLGRAHTAADLVVHLPQENIVISGDLIVHPVPLIGSTSYPLEYGATLEKMLALQPKIIIPGHGPVMREDSYAKLMIQMLASLKQQIESAVRRGETLEQARKSVNLEEFRKGFAGNSQHKSVVFKNYVTNPAITAAFRQAMEKK